MAAVSQSFPQFLGEIMPLIDRAMSLQEIAIKQRPLWAAIEFVENFVMEVQTDDLQGKPDTTSAHFYSSQFFRVLYQAVREWYEDRYGRAFSEPIRETISGFVLIWETAFALEVPSTVVKPGEPGKTIWLSFPDDVLDNENPADWLVKPPNLEAIPEDERGKIGAAIREVSRMLRSINSKIMGIPVEDPVIEGLLDQVWHNVQSAATKSVEGKAGQANPGAYWDIQMACECAYKALLQVKVGSFPKTHDLRQLHALAEAHGVAITRDVLDRLPRAGEMVSMRYGQERAATWELHDAYLAMLQIVEAVLAPIVELVLGKGALEIAKAPWLERVPRSKQNKD